MGADCLSFFLSFFLNFNEGYIHLDASEMEQTHVGALACKTEGGYLKNILEESL